MKDKVVLITGAQEFAKPLLCALQKRGEGNHLDGIGSR
jgi:hypothetical protein